MPWTAFTETHVGHWTEGLLAPASEYLLVNDEPLQITLVQVCTLRGITQ